MNPRFLLDHPVTDDTFLEAPMPDARFDRRYLPLDQAEDGACFSPARVAIFAGIGACGWAAFVCWVF